jgi:hypothetical protein
LTIAHVAGAQQGTEGGEDQQVAQGESHLV